MTENRANLRKLKKLLNENRSRKGDTLKKVVGCFLIFTAGVMFGYAWAYIAMVAK